MSRLFLKYRRVNNFNQQGTKHSQHPKFNIVFVFVFLFVFVVVDEDDNKTDWTRDASHMESTIAHVIGKKTH